MSDFFHHLDLTVSDPAKSRPLYELFLGHCGFTLKSAGEDVGRVRARRQALSVHHTPEGEGAQRGAQARPLFARAASPRAAREVARGCRCALQEAEEVRRDILDAPRGVCRLRQGLLRRVLRRSGRDQAGIRLHAGRPPRCAYDARARTSPRSDHFRSGEVAAAVRARPRPHGLCRGRAKPTPTGMPNGTCRATASCRSASCPPRRQTRSAGMTAIHQACTTPRGRAPTARDVDALYDKLKAFGATILDPPAEYPQYNGGRAITPCSSPTRMG